MANFIKVERVSIKNHNKPRQKQTLTILHIEIFNNEIYWYVQERMCAIPQNILIKTK
jgi:hypothetical protein